MRCLLLVLCCLAVTLYQPSSTSAKSKRKLRQARSFDRGTIKLVHIEKKKSSLSFRWNSPGGKVIHYKPKRLYSGLRIKLLRYATYKKPVALGGKFSFLSGNVGVVEPSFAHRVHRYRRGAMAVKFDGWMPLYKVTRLATETNNNALIYELRGRISTAMAHRDNKLVCTFGTWFDLLDYTHSRTQQRRGMVNQTNGIKGHSMYWFPKAYKHPRSWHNMTNFKEKMAAFRAARRRQKKGLPPVKWVIRVPRVPSKSIAAYDKLCEKRLSALERKISMPKFVVIEPLPKKDPPKKAAPAKTAPKKVEPKKAAPTKRAAPAKAAPAKAAPKKAEPKKAVPVKAAPKKAAPAKRAASKKAPASRPAPRR